MNTNKLPCRCGQKGPQCMIHNPPFEFLKTPTPQKEEKCKCGDIDRKNVLHRKNDPCLDALKQEKKIDKIFVTLDGKEVGSIKVSPSTTPSWEVTKLYHQICSLFQIGFHVGSCGKINGTSAVCKCELYHETAKTHIQDAFSQLLSDERRKMVEEHNKMNTLFITTLLKTWNPPQDVLEKLKESLNSKE